MIEVKKDASEDVVLNQLYRFSSLQTSFGVNMLALNGGTPEQMNLRQILQAFIRFREEVVTRRTKFELNKARDRAHVLVGLALAVANIDEVIRIIRQAPDPSTAREQLLAETWSAADMAPLIRLIADRRTVMSDEDTTRLSDEQARAILELRLHRLTGLGRDEIGNEATGLAERIADYLDILRSRARVLDIIRAELNEVRDNFAVPRRSEIVESDLDIDDEDLIEREEMVVTFTHGGYVKRTPLSTYRSQHRGGKGRSGMSMKDEDFVTRLFAASTHAEVLFFSSTGMVYKHKVYKLPLGNPQARGKALINLLPLAEGETISTLLPMPEDEESWADSQLMFATVSGTVRRNSAADFRSVMANGKIAMKLDEGDRIVGVQFCGEDDDVLLAAGGGKCIRFQVPEVRLFKGRSSQGVRGMSLDKKDRLISMTILHHTGVTPEERDGYFGRKRDDEIPELPPARRAALGADEQFLLTVRDDGHGKRTSAHDYRVTRRGGRGVINIDVGKKGKVVAAFPVAEEDEIMLVTDGGQLIRCAVHDISKVGRAARGVRIFRLAKDGRVVSVAHLGESANGDDEASGEADEEAPSEADGEGEEDTQE